MDSNLTLAILDNIQGRLMDDPLCIAGSAGFLGMVSIPDGFGWVGGVCYRIQGTRKTR
ncbi:uncharacterized protein BDW47DRAFT_100584 [Aspergillus candidus]|uniref:Uncharacterized protein n=1 Tax=Aspergillus candidus TaxID=41067 RepID=A0A2I2FJ48_ASPCN|nr:hypothetical protein BDW47DRAFT_100584 [Aspergillus candidus]PLB40646.1 hypothetical protein BDW47DRAFT_100584 [Aspergillus candidus]